MSERVDVSVTVGNTSLGHTNERSADVAAWVGRLLADNPCFDRPLTHDEPTEVRILVYPG